VVFFFSFDLLLLVPPERRVRTPICSFRACGGRPLFIQGFRWLARLTPLWDRGIHLFPEGFFFFFLQLLRARTMDVLFLSCSTWGATTSGFSFLTSHVGYRELTSRFDLCGPVLQAMTGGSERHTAGPVLRDIRSTLLALGPMWVPGLQACRVSLFFFSLPRLVLIFI